jgi:hypothetical protein
MALTRKWLIVLLAAAAGLAADKEKPKFAPAPIESYQNRQTAEGVTVAAEAYRSDSQTTSAFGKLDPNKYGVLPVLVVIRNSSGQTLSLDRLRIEFVTSDREHIEATPAKDIRYLAGAQRPKVYTLPIPGAPPRISKKKNPLDAWEIEGHAFSARMLPANETASGFFYFRTFYHPGSTFLLSGIREAGTGKELFYFEIPLN